MKTDTECCKRTPVGNCSQCSKNAQWNSPALDPQGNLWCDRCKDENRTGVLLKTVNQFQEDGLYIFDGGASLNGASVQVYDGEPCAWVEGGSRAVRLTDAEKKLSAEAIVRLLDQEHNVEGLTRCTGCGVKMTKDEIAGYPLFAGVTCATCWQEHQEHLEIERKNGHVCRMCRQPYGNCCC